MEYFQPSSPGVSCVQKQFIMIRQDVMLLKDAGV